MSVKNLEASHVCRLKYPELQRIRALSPKTLTEVLPQPFTPTPAKDKQYPWFYFYSSSSRLTSSTLEGVKQQRNYRLVRRLW